MKAHHIENLVLLFLVLGLVLVIYVIFYRPDWLMLIATYKG